MKIFRNVPRKFLLISFAVGLLALITAGSSFALLTAKTNTQTNRFTPGVADISVSEPYGSSYTPDDNNTVNKIVQIKNESHIGEDGQEHAIPVYVRVRLVPVMRNAAGEGTGEPAEVSYPDINAGTGHAWTEQQDDGYYYYKGILNPKGVTPELINTAKIEGRLPGDRKLEIQVIADSIQTKGNAEEKAWGMQYTPDSNTWSKATAR